MNWFLPNITPEQYDEIYKGTEAMDVKGLFERTPTSDEDAIMNFYPSKLWRMCSGIYKIEDKEGNLIPFKFTLAQHKVYAHLLRHKRLVILKSRQLRRIYDVLNLRLRLNFNRG